MSNQSGIGTEVYSGMAEYGKIRSGISLVFVTIIALVFIIIGGYLAFRKETYTRKVIGKIEKSECTVVTRGDKKSYNCSLEIKYKVNDKEYTLNTISESSTQYVVGNNIDVYVNEENHSDASIQSGYKKIGWIMIGIALVIWIGTALHFYFSLKYKGFAAFTGASDVASAFSGMRRY